MSSADERDALGRGQRGRRAAAVDEGQDQHELGAVGPHHRGRLQGRGAPGGGVLGDHHLVAGLERAGDAALDAVVLGLLADAEAPQHPPAGGGDRGDAEGDRVGAHRQPADGRGLGRDHLERGVGHEHDAVGAAGRLLGVEEPVARACPTSA